MSERKLWLDDVRDPPDGSWDVVRSYDEFTEYIDKHGVPDVISFDHDLGTDTRNGFYCAQYVTQTREPIGEWYVHSDNPVGAENIRKLLQNYHESVDFRRNN